MSDLKLVFDETHFITIEVSAEQSFKLPNPAGIQLPAGFKMGPVAIHLKGEAVCFEITAIKEIVIEIATPFDCQ